ncbi:UNVERIFIED_CONTAM: hypothetical protein Slati_4464400 [Sesamum latifolium]|uniref:Uncharacterized protein n=1 Tax=Sesamum latifolium TaxID=2727402 RepID=A0AAW2SRB5_9LAMI
MCCWVDGGGLRLPSSNALDLINERIGLNSFRLCTSLSPTHSEEEGCPQLLFRVGVPVMLRGGSPTLECQRFKGRCLITAPFYAFGISSNYSIKDGYVGERGLNTPPNILSHKLTSTPFHLLSSRLLEGLELHRQHISFFMASSMASSDEFVHFIKEVLPDHEPLEATSRRMGPDPSAFYSGRRWSLRQAAAVARRLIDEEYVRDERDEADEGGEVGEGSEVGGILPSGRGEGGPPFVYGLGVLQHEEF